MSVGNESCELLRAIARQTSDAQLVHRLAMRVQDWDALIDTAREHRMLPMLFLQLDDMGSAVPPLVQEQMRSEYNRNVFHNLTNAVELIAVIKAFDDQTIPAMPFKGVVLGASAYGENGNKLPPPPQSAPQIQGAACVSRTVTERYANCPCWADAGVNFRVQAGAAGSCFACIRPENIVIGDRIEAEGGNIIEARVEALLFAGERYECLLDFAGTKIAAVASRNQPLAEGEILLVGQLGNSGGEKIGAFTRLHLKAQARQSGRQDVRAEPAAGLPGRALGPSRSRSPRGR